MKNQATFKILTAIIFFLICFFVKGEISYAESDSPYIVSFCIDFECESSEDILEMIDLCMEEVSAKEADFIVLPFFEYLDGDFIAEEMSILAQAGKVWIFYGAKQDILNEDLQYDAVYIISPEGKIDTYQCMSNEEGALGNSPCIVNTEFGDIGIAGKNDLYLVPELSRYYAALGCRTVINPMAICKDIQWTDSIMERDGSKIIFSRFKYTNINPESSDINELTDQENENSIVVSRNHVNLTKTVYSDVNGNHNFKEDLYSEWYADIGNDLDTEESTDVLMPNMKAVDFTPVWGNPQKNLQKMKVEIQQAYDDAVDIIVFPELALQGYCYSESNSSESHQMPIREAVDQNSDAVIELSGIAAEYNMYIIFGSSEIAYDQDGNRMNKVYNSAFVCCPDGRILTYRKIHTVEGTWCLRGNTPMFFDTEYGKIGIGICKDSFSYPELSRFYYGKGCTYYINLSASSTARGMNWEEYYQSRLQMIADINHMTVISANMSGTQYDSNGVSHGKFGGNSCILYPIYDTYEVSFQADLYSQMYQVLEGTLQHEKLIQENEVYIKKRYIAGQDLKDYTKAGETVIYGIQYEIWNVKKDTYTGYLVKQYQEELLKKQEIEESIPNQTFIYSRLYYLSDDSISDFPYQKDNRTVSFTTDKPGQYLFIQYFDSRMEYQYFKYLQEFQFNKEFINIFS